jgi:hypothetical protein
MEAAPDRTLAPFQTLRRPWILAILFSILAAARFLPILSDPLDGSMASLNAAFTGRYLQCWQKAGFGELRGATHMVVSPWAELEREPYLHHPPVYPWFVAATVKGLGFTEAGIRALPVLLSALACGALVLLLARLAGTAAAVVCGIVYITSPMSLFFGWMPNPESGVLCMAGATMLLHDHLRGGPWRPYLWTWLPFVMGTWCDWQMNFVTIALVAGECMLPRGERRLARTLGLVLAGGLSFLAVIVYFSYVQGSLAGGIRVLTATAVATADASGNPPVAEWIGNQIRFWKDLYSIPVALAAVAAVLIAIPRALFRRDTVARWIVIFTIFGTLNVAAFRKHAFDHQFWWYYALPLACAAPAWLATGFSRKHRVALAVVACVFCGAAGIYRIREQYNFWRPVGDKTRQLGNEWNSIAGERDALFLPFDLGPETFYLKSWFCVPTPDRERYFERLDAAAKRGFRTDRLVCVVPENICNIILMKDWAARLRSYGEVRHYDADQFAMLAPTISALYCRPAVDILVVTRK